ncbi:hypothetical protein NBH19_16900 [Rhizobium sp. S95]|uniref:Uncharacterized protein n=1 Tax=Ciceribacter sichuanensis TaxID=2949647 RepID=A0AAJ1C1K6_9HYPH|nr:MULTISPECIES: hypothetical protein [unclassified Ciceribacter]MCM2397752.1 hypothetical protein [Ciceribacter sp. S95]MCO5960091.1 hypothetical protein [Ciceribacter sp. S101]
MDTSPLSLYRQEFAKRAEWRREDEHRFLEKLKLEQDKEKKLERDERERQDEQFLDMVVAVLATETEVKDFTVKLDAYDTAIIEALYENEEKMKIVRQDLKVLLDQAYVLPDGRRVFKTEDGTRIFDEHGAEVTDLDPDLIDEKHPYWEKYEGPFKQKFALEEERKELLEFQKRTDDARAELDEGGMTKDRLDELETILAKNAPDAVKRRMGHDAEPANQAAPTPKNDEPLQVAPSRAGAKLDMPAL